MVVCPGVDREALGGFVEDADMDCLAHGRVLQRHPQALRIRPETGRKFFIDNLLVRIHSIIEIILVNRPCAIGF